VANGIMQCRSKTSATRSLMTFRVTALATILALIPAVATAQDPETDILNRERALVDAMQARDRGRLDLLLAPDFFLRSSPDITRGTWLDNAVTLCWGRRADIDHFRAQSIGAVIIAYFDLTFYADPISCRPAVRRSVITDVWASEGPVWRLAMRHAAPPPAADAGVAAQYGAVPEPPPTWDVSGELSYVATGGNTSTRTAGLANSTTHNRNGHLTRAAVAFISSEADGVTQAESLRVQGRHGFRIGKRMELFAEAEYARDRFAGIDHRLASGIGVSYTAALPPRHTLRAEASAGYNTENRLDATEQQFATAVGGLHYTWTMRPGVRLAEDAGFTGDLETGANWRTASTTAITVTVTRLLSLKASHVFEYRHAPVPGFGRLDLRTSAALVFSIQRRPPIQ
jgi:putative salt-induced outer membrane protein YdiY